MILAVDSSALVLLLNPADEPPRDPVTNEPVTHARERIEHFLASLGPNDSLIIPTPVLAEVLIQAGEGGPGVLEEITGKARLKIKAFGERAAIETAIMTREAIDAGDKKGGSEEPWQRVKIDRQVIAVARAERATRIYSDDRGLVNFARRIGMDAFSTWDLPLPEKTPDLFSSIDANAEPARSSDGDPQC